MKKQLLLLSLVGMLPLAACVPDHWPAKWVAMTKPKPKTEKTEPAPQWCYSSLAAIDCYDAPRPDAADRLVAPPVMPQPKPVGKPLKQRTPAPKGEPLPAPLPLYSPDTPAP